VRYLVVYAAIVAAMLFFFHRLPTAFLPDEDQGFIICQMQLPAGGHPGADPAAGYNG